MLYWGRAIVRESGWQNMWKQCDIGVSWKWDSNDCTLVSCGKRHEFNESYHDSWYETKNAWLVMYGKWQWVVEDESWLCVSIGHKYCRVFHHLPALTKCPLWENSLAREPLKSSMASEELLWPRVKKVTIIQVGEIPSPDRMYRTSHSCLYPSSVMIQSSFVYEWFHDWVEKKEVLNSLFSTHSFKHKKL